jgi:glutathione peroxidase
MTDITAVRGRNAHPFFAWMAREHRFQPRWNFNKVLLGRDGRVIETFGSRTEPLSRDMVSAIETALSG